MSRRMTLWEKKIRQAGGGSSGIPEEVKRDAEDATLDELEATSEILGRLDKARETLDERRKQNE